MRWRLFEKQNAKQDNAIPQPLAKQQEALADVRCPLCGNRFSAGDALQCSSCALAKKCGLVMCPKCSYEFPA